MLPAIEFFHRLFYVSLSPNQPEIEDRPSAAAPPEPPAATKLPGQNQVIWVLWATYGTFYFCRNNLAVALPGIQEEFDYSKAQLGLILMVLKLSYGVGQFINGQLAEQFSPRKLLAIGMLGSALLNVLFGWGTALYFLLFVWACNGYVQALGWTPTMRVAANWFPARQRGKAIGIIGTGYQLGGALTFVIAGWAATKFGWRGALYVPAILLTVSAVHMLFFLREKPALNGDGTHHPGGPKPQAKRPFRENIAITLGNPALWIVAVTLCLLDATRYGFSDWGITHLNETLDISVGVSALKYAVLPFGGMAGAVVAGMATDRFFQGRRAPVIFILLVLLGFAAIAYDSVIHWGIVPSIVILFAIGFCIFGSQVMLVGTFPVDLARGGAAAAAVGFVNFMGYMGAAAGDLFTGLLADAYGWRVAIYFWAGCAFAGAVFIGFLWRRRGNNH